MNIFRVEWHYYDGCDESHCVQGTYSTIEVAEQVRDFLMLMGMYQQDLARIESDLLNKRRGYSVDTLIQMARAKGIPDAVFPWHRGIAGHLGIQFLGNEINLPWNTDQGYRIISDTVLTEVPDFAKAI